MRNGGISFWHRQIGVAPPREPLDGSRTADVAIAGGGYTGLWTAYYLKRARPELEIVVLEREFCGFGASGRNGGWVSSAFAGSRETMARSHGRARVIALQRQMQAAVDEVLAVARAEKIDADLIKPGMVRVARGMSQLNRIRRQVADDRSWDLTEDDVRLLDMAETERLIHVAGASGAEFIPHCARSHPGKLVTGLARAVEGLGVRLYEDTTVTSIEPGVARTDRGDVRARTVLTCLEGFTASLPSQRRSLLPLNSAMVVTDPLPDRMWDDIGWQGCELLGDGAHAYMYAQRTADGRIALGGRGVPYRFGSRTDNWGATQRLTIDQLTEILHSMFPQTREVGIDQAWCGVLGVRRDWIPAIGYDPASGLGGAGGYVGNGVATTNLAGRTLRDLVLGEQTELTGLPFVNHHGRDWEPEPLRFIGAQLVYGLYRAADRHETRRGEAVDSPLAHAASLISGRH
ncbi:MAG TPA: FAD-binding oxidoreductase [Kofleriaceae bacterium]|jgi:glycine/D-amino acid oxidase-like deaminating enzyme|nr:FAD-binding oxidoreductase [Kofleriaceae bacterium]